MKTLPALARTVAVVNARHDEVSWPDALAAVLRAGGEDPDDVAGIDAAEAERCGVVVDRLAEVFRADGVDEAAGLLNVLLAVWCHPPRLVRHAGWGWHLHLDAADDAPWSEWLGAGGAFALAAALAADPEALGTCAAAGCDRVFAHDRRGGPRRFCSTTCGTRTRVARHRATAGR